MVGDSRWLRITCPPPSLAVVGGVGSDAEKLIFQGLEGAKLLGKAVRHGCPWSTPGPALSPLSGCLSGAGKLLRLMVLESGRG